MGNFQLREIRKKQNSVYSYQRLSARSYEVDREGSDEERASIHEMQAAFETGQTSYMVDMVEMGTLMLEKLQRFILKNEHPYGCFARFFSASDVELAAAKKLENYLISIYSIEPEFSPQEIKALQSKELRSIVCKPEWQIALPPTLALANRQLAEKNREVAVHCSRVII